MYYLTTTAKRENARRHIVIKGNDLDILRKVGKNNINENVYDIDIYTGKWKFVERINN